MLLLHKIRLQIRCPFVLSGPYLSILDIYAVSSTSRRNEITNDHWFANLVILNCEGTFNVQALNLIE